MCYQSAIVLRMNNSQPSPLPGYLHCWHILNFSRLPFAFINTDVARAAILCMLEEANKAEMVREKCPPYIINYYTLLGIIISC